MEQTIGLHAENCQPPLGQSPELIEYLRGLKEGERVVECAVSGMTGRLGTVYVRERDGAPQVCVRWDQRPDEEGQMGTSVTGGARRLKDAGNFSHLDDAPKCTHGCNQTGHAPDTCAGFQMGDTIRFASHHIAAGDYGVIVGLERWLNDNETVPWDGVGDAPFYAGKFTTPNVERFLVRLESHNPETKDSTIGGLDSWRERCLQWPHSYPFVVARDMQLVSRPQIAKLNDSGCLGSVLGQDSRQSLACISDSEAGVRKAMADMKAAACLRLHYPPSTSDSKTLNFYCQEVTETKVADQIDIGFKFWMQTLFGIRAARVTEIDDVSGSAVTQVGGHQGRLKRKDDGWYDQHIIGNPDAISKLQFAP